MVKNQAHANDLLTTQEADDYYTESGAVQCDPHLREKNEQRGQEQIMARNRLVFRFLPFIWLQDERLEPVELMKTVALRLWRAAEAEENRRKQTQ